MNNQPMPSKWGQDNLTRYLDSVHGNQIGAFSNKQPQVTDMIAIDKMFLYLLKNVENPNPLFPIIFLLRSHSSYLAAAGTAMAGSIYETKPLLRSCLELAGYAHYIGDDEERFKLWASRHDSPKAKQAVRREFSNGSKISKHIAENDKNLADAYKYLYDETIDCGAHPNIKGVRQSQMIVDTDDGGKRGYAFYLHDDVESVDSGLKFVAQVGLLALRIGQTIYPVRAKEMGIQDRLFEMFKRYEICA